MGFFEKKNDVALTLIISIENFHRIELDIQFGKA